MPFKRLLPTAFFVCAAAACSAQPPGSQAPGPVPTTPLSVAPPAVLVGTGDIAKCGSAGTIGTAKLLDGIPGTVFTTGDNVYDHGTAQEFKDCYGPTWGRHKDRTRPAPGNHEYETHSATPYYGYFGAAAGPAGQGYYSYRLGGWLVLSLNSETRMSPGSEQHEWLRNELQESPSACTFAYFHRPLFSSGPNGDNPDVRPLWRLLQEFGADVIVSGHDHLYERYGLQDPDGRPDPVRGIRQFVVGTGGGDRYSMLRSRPTSEARGTDWGVVKFNLNPSGYTWEFIPIAGATFRDSGSDVCR